MLFHGKTDCLGRYGSVLCNRRTQRILHRVLAVSCRQLQDFQIFASSSPGASILAQPVISHTEVARGKHFLAVLVVLKSTRLADQRIDHMAVVDGMLVRADQTWHLLNQQISVPDFDEVCIDRHIDFVSDQSTGNRISVPLDSDRAAAVDLDAAVLSPVVQLGRWQFPEDFQFLLQSRRP